jgi:hypothetical protein
MYTKPEMDGVSWNFSPCQGFVTPGSRALYLIPPDLDLGPHMELSYRICNKLNVNYNLEEKERTCNRSKARHFEIYDSATP